MRHFMEEYGQSIIIALFGAIAIGILIHMISVLESI